MKNSFLIISFFSIFTMFLLGDNNAPTFYKKVMQQNIEAFEYEDEDWSTEDYYEFLSHTMKSQATLQEFRKRRAVFLMYDKVESQKNTTNNNPLTDQTTWKDLSLFCGQEDKKIFFADKIDRTTTMFGRAYLYGQLVHGTTDVATIKQRQNIIKFLLNSPLILEKLEKLLAQFKRSENFFISFWANDPLKTTLSRSFFSLSSPKINDFLNHSELIMGLRNAAEHKQRLLWVTTAALASVFLPLYGISKIANVSMSATMEKGASHLHDSFFGFVSSFIENNAGLGGLAIASGIYTGLHLKDAAKWASANFSLDTFVLAKMQHVACCISTLHEMHTFLKSYFDFTQLCECHSFFPELFEQKANNNQNIKKLFELLHTQLFKEKPSLLMNRGRVLVTTKLFFENQEHFESVLMALGELDMYVSLAKLIKEFESKKVNFCFAEFSDNKTPLIVLNNFWNPFIDADKVISNSIELGGQHKQNSIITGPNAGGKSTILKALALAILMAQSFGIAPARSCIITPFTIINSYLNIRDDIGAGNSLFKAQAVRAQQLLDKIGNLKADQFAFTIIDEMFNGTSPKEAQAAAFSVAKNMGKITNNITLVATHYDLVTSLEDKTGLFENYNVSVIRNDDQRISYPFLLSRGISHQHVALDILQEQGFNGSILEDARKVMKGQD